MKIFFFFIRKDRFVTKIGLVKIEPYLTWQQHDSYTAVFYDQITKIIHHLLAVPVVIFFFVSFLGRDADDGF